MIFGGQSREHEVSVNSAEHVIAAASEHFDVVPIGVTKSGAWLTPDETRSQLGASTAAFAKAMELEGASGILARPAALAVLQQLDAAFPLIHGTFGEDGTLQGFLELAGVPYAGAGVAASAIGMDKALMKRLLRQAGLDVVDFLVIRATQYHREPRPIIEAIEESIGYPAFVKPANGGSSVGVSKVRSREEIGSALCTAFQFDRKVLVEHAVTAREVECAVLGNDDPQPSPIGEVTYAGEFYDYDAKYLDPETKLLIPAKLTAEIASQIQDLAVRGYRALDCSGMGRLDFFLTDEGDIYLDEINTLPGFAPTSMYPRLWQEAGLSYSHLIGRLVELGIERHREQRRG